ncbi:MAG TPA: hypothetical protein VIK82_01765, partial [Porticoccaceae bacterium]
MEGEEDLLKGIRYLREHCEKIGREDMPRLVIGSISPPGRKMSPQEMVDTIGRLGEFGISCVALSVQGESRAEWCDNARRLAEDVVAKCCAVGPS